MAFNLRKVVAYLTEDIWRIRLRRQPRSKSFLIRTLRIVLLALRKFAGDKCLSSASALTFYTLLAIVPILAMAFGVAQGFGLEKVLERRILETAAGQEEVIQEAIVFAENLLEETQGGLIAGIGVAILVWTVIKVLGYVERSLNDIWGISKSRSLARKFSEYVSIILLGPLLLIMASSLIVFITAQVRIAAEDVSLLAPLGPVILLGIRGIPYVIIWFLFTFIYTFIPNTKVNFKSGLIAGVLAGTIYVIVQWAYINFQVGISKYNAIYGSFAALPLFLIWLRLSWLIVLFGAEVSFAHQNVDTYEFEPDAARVSTRFKRLVALSVTRQVVKRFARGLDPLTAPQLSRQMEIPIRLLRQVLSELVESGILVETVAEDEDQPAFQPAVNIDLITFKFVTDALDHRGVDNLDLAPGEDFLTVREQVRKIDALTEQLPENYALKDLA